VFCAAPPAIKTALRFCMSSSYRVRCFSSARMASFAFRPYFSSRASSLCKRKIYKLRRSTDIKFHDWRIGELTLGLGYQGADSPVPEDCNCREKPWRNQAVVWIFELKVRSRLRVSSDGSVGLKVSCDGGLEVSGAREELYRRGR
jgi:hypothetical protein